MLTRLALVAALLPALAIAQEYPTKPIRLVVPFPPGGGTDYLARAVAQKVTETKGWTIVVDNKAGANGTIGLREMANADASGYDIVIGQTDNLAIAPSLYKNITYNASSDFVPISMVASSPIILITAADSPLKTLKDVIAAAKMSPDKITYGTPGAGSVAHLTVELLEQEAGVALQAVPYRGSAPALVDTMGGQVALMSSSIPSVLSQIKAGKVRALAVSSKERSAILPDVPTIAEQGYPGFDVAVWYGIFGPKNMPERTAGRLNTEINNVLGMPDLQKLIAAQGASVTPITAGELGAQLTQDSAKWAKLIQDTKITLD